MAPMFLSFSRKMNSLNYDPLSMIDENEKTACSETCKY